MQSGLGRKGAKRRREHEQVVLREYRKYKEDKGRESQFSEDLQILLHSQFCLDVLQESKIKNLMMSMICPLEQKGKGETVRKSNLSEGS